MAAATLSAAVRALDKALGGRCRRDHILKQHPRWGFTHEGGEFTWTAPSGRRYTVGPGTHPV